MIVVWRILFIFEVGQEITKIVQRYQSKNIDYAGLCQCMVRDDRDSL